MTEKHRTGGNQHRADVPDRPIKCIQSRSPYLRGDAQQHLEWDATTNTTTQLRSTTARSEAPPLKWMQVKVETTGIHHLLEHEGREPVHKQQGHDNGEHRSDSNHQGLEGPEQEEREHPAQGDMELVHVFPWVERTCGEKKIEVAHCRPEPPPPCPPLPSAYCSQLMSDDRDFSLLQSKP